MHLVQASKKSVDIFNHPTTTASTTTPGTADIFLKGKRKALEDLSPTSSQGSDHLIKKRSRIQHEIVSQDEEEEAAKATSTKKRRRLLKKASSSEDEEQNSPKAAMDCDESVPMAKEHAAGSLKLPKAPKGKRYVDKQVTSFDADGYLVTKIERVLEDIPASAQKEKAKPVV